MKWTVAGAGALLSVAGAYALITGASIIQVERGWATFIAGAVLLGAGVIVFAIAALIGRIDYLTDIYIASVEDLEDEPAVAVVERDVATRPQPVRRDAPASNENSIAAMPPREARVYQPAPEPLPVAPEPEPEPEPEPAPVITSVERPPALQNFKFVFPPAEAAPEPVAEPVPEPAAEAPRFEPQKPAGRSGLTWLRRTRAAAESEPEPEPAPAPELPADAPAESATLAGENFDDQSEPAPEAAPPEPAREAFELDAEPRPDPFSNDWLERALAGADEPRNGRATPAALRRVAALEGRPEDEAAPDTPASDEPAPAQAEASVDAPAQETGASHESGADTQAAEAARADLPDVAAEASRTGAAPVEIGRYRANEVAYVMYSDGSITAETPAGASYRFNSLVELRAFIERGGA